MVQAYGGVLVWEPPDDTPAYWYIRSRKGVGVYEAGGWFIWVGCPGWALSFFRVIYLVLDTLLLWYFNARDSQPHQFSNHPIQNAVRNARGCNASLGI